MNQEQRQIGEEMQNLFSEFKNVHEQSREEMNKLGVETKESREKLERMHDRLDMLETKWNRPKIQSADRTVEPQSEYSKAFWNYIKKGDDKIRNMELKVSFPNLNETIDPQGGYLVPPEFSDFLVDSLVQWSPIRKYATKIKMNRKEFKIPVQQQQQNLVTGAAASGFFPTSWGDDLSLITQTNTGLLGQKSIVACDLNALPYATTDFLEDDMYGNGERYIMDNLAKSMAYAEGDSFVNGDGILEPTGFLTNVATTYPATSLVTATGTTATLGTKGKVLIDAYYALPDFYARNAVWFMHRQTIRIVREFVDGQGQYLWTPTFGNTLSTEAPGMILGAPYQEVINMPAPTAVNGSTYTAGVYPVCFGDMKSAYYIGDRVGMRMLRDPYSSKPYVQFWVRSRVGGNVILPEALAFIKVAA